MSDNGELFMIDPHQQKQAAREFQERWKDRGNENQDMQVFWLELLRDVYGVDNATEYIKFHGAVQLRNMSEFDAYIPSTKVLIEQKSKRIDLNRPYLQSDGALLTPYEQAKRYSDWLKYSELPRWILVSNFQEFHIHDQERPNADPEIVLLKDLDEEFYRLNFLVDTEDDKIHKELKVSLQAGEIVGILYKALLEQYVDPEDEKNLKDLNILCVRIVFCLYAEDAGLFGRRSAFRDFLQRYRNDPDTFRRALMDLFKVLDTKPEDRDLYISPKLASFPYVNGGLFEDKTAVIPTLSDEIINIILDKASYDFDWSEISPTIFGSVFESTLNPESRRKGGMHYTSIKNIHKVIDPLFLNDLHSEFEKIADMKQKNRKERKLHRFQDKLGSLKFLDPACGSGNFLTETYLSLRQLENKVLIELYGQQVAMGDMVSEANPLKVSISQFYGIEVNDFAVSVANTALWISESQMLQATLDIVYTDTEFLPLTTSAHIVEGNALRMDWEDVVPKEELDYIMGNPPFVTQHKRTEEQSNDMQHVFGRGSPNNKLDYVLCWYKKASDYIQNTDIKVAFVSTNSISQGESVPVFWKSMFEIGNNIIFAYQSFLWTSEAADEAQVYCVIIGFKHGENPDDFLLYSGDEVRVVNNINAYLLDAPNVWITSRSNIPKTGLPKMTKGSEPADGGNLFFTKDEYVAFIERNTDSDNLFRPYIGGAEFLDVVKENYNRYCLWLKNIPNSEYRKIPEVVRRLDNIKESRKKSTASRIRKMADYPYLFSQDRQPDVDYLVFPRHSTMSRTYLPIGYMSSDVIVGDACYIIPSASLYIFGCLISKVHMAWMKTICGRLGMAYRYSPFIYNNFPWPLSTEQQKLRIEQNAQGILTARDLFPDSSLADLYDERTMQRELRDAHDANDKAVMEAYGFNWRTMSEEDVVAELMKMYQEQVQNADQT